ncbi:MAG: ABC transporter permease [Candidatus Dormibacteraceae bacterium]
MRAEWLKTWKRPAVWILFGILLLLLAVLGYLLSWLLLTHPPSGSRFPRGTRASDFKASLYPASLVLNALGEGATFGGAVALILGVLSAGSEYGWGTFKTVFTQRPTRVVAWISKLTVVGILAALLTIAVYAVAALCSLVLARVDGVASSWPAATTVLRGLGAMWLIYMMWASLGMLLSVAFRQSALAVGLGLVYLLILESIVFRIVGESPSLRYIERPFPGANASALVDSFGHITIRGLRAATPSALVSAGQASIVLALYVCAFLVLAGALLHRRDVT